MSLTSVKMSEDVWLTCLTHALSSETEEIMGLLLGDIEHSKDSVTALIWGASPQTRSDRRKDRVETNPEQLAAASAQAERMSKSTGRTTRVIGWYHSHPHITVLPSHVDVRTQGMYQLLDSGFIGLIFSCFSEDAHKVGRIQVIAFQSTNGKQDHMSVPISGEESFGGSYLSESSQNVMADIDPMELSDSMQEAMHRSNLEMSGAQYIRKEIPLYVLPTSSLIKLDTPLKSFTDLQRVLFDEERAAYNQAIFQNTRDGKVHPLTFIHHTATYQASMCKLIEYCLSPAINALQDRLRENEIRMALLSEEAKALEAEASRGSEQVSRSPRQAVAGPRGSLSPGNSDFHSSAESKTGGSPGSWSRRVVDEFPK